MEQGPQIVLKMLLHGLVVGVIYSSGSLFCIATCTTSGRKGTKGDMYITSPNNEIKNASWTPKRKFGSGTEFWCLFNDF